MFLTASAAKDLEELYDYVAANDSPARADYLLGRIEDSFTKLAAYPERGAHPKELLAIGVREYRELFFKPYRIIYHVTGKKVFVPLIADGRRDMQTMLQNRLLSAET
ncbi:MAG: type II toxin-antitoxin system RelE/ParE family toxin [Nitrospinae bacterium]|nr:type II toxin-antitoxin system RelE/ParE family toxin [Nitrospinota bacterium]